MRNRSLRYPSSMRHWLNNSTWSQEPVLETQKLVKKLQPPSKRKARNSCTEAGKKSDFISTTSALPSSWHDSGRSENKKNNLQLLPWEAKRRLEHSSHVLAFQGSAQGAGFCPTGLRALTGNQYTLGGWGQMAGRELGIWLQQQRTSDRFVQKPAQLQVVRRKCQFVAITLGGKEKTEMYTQHSRFVGASWRTGFCLAWLRVLMEPAYFGFPGVTEQNRAQRLLSALENL